MANELLIAFATLGASIGFLIGPVFVWLGWNGVQIRLWGWKMRSGRFDASLYVDKGNNIRLLFKKRDGSRVRIRGGTYVSTPDQKLIYRFMGIPVRLRRENDPEDVDIWAHDNQSGMTAKELDNVINEAESAGLLAALKSWLPIGIMIVIILAILAAGSLYLAYLNFDILQQIAPSIAKFFPEGFKL